MRANEPSRPSDSSPSTSYSRTINRLVGSRPFVNDNDSSSLHVPSDKFLIEVNWTDDSYGRNKSRLDLNERSYLFFSNDQCSRWYRSAINRPEALCSQSISKVESCCVDEIAVSGEVQRWNHWIATVLTWWISSETLHPNEESRRSDSRQGYRGHHSCA